MRSNPKARLDTGRIGSCRPTATPACGAHHATTTEDAEGNVLITDLTQQDIDLALEAASTVGDDHIKETTQGQTNPETWNHGSSKQRMHWFAVGYEQGSLDACDTFAADEE
jgi:predicted metalloprotease